MTRRRPPPFPALGPRPMLASVLVAGALFGLGGCGDEDVYTAPEPPAGAVDLTGQAAVTVTIEDNKFVPRYVVVSAGTEVVWVNEGRNDHDILPDTPGAFEPVTPVLNAGEEASRPFPQAGAFTYYCSLHGFRGINRGQNGQVFVVGE